MMKDLISQNRLFSILHEELAGEVGPEHPVLADLMEYADIYARINGIAAAEAEAAYLKFIGTYRRDVLEFARSGRYPMRTGAQEISRVEYDVALLLSTVLTKPRFRIMQLLAERALPAESSLFVGVGSGLELYLLRNRLKAIAAFDVRINPFLRDLLPQVTFCEAEFTGAPRQYDQIFLIELLEHLDSPFDLIAQCGAALKTGGQIHMTTATNIPQFDHRYNFPAPPAVFEAWLREHGFETVYREEIRHPPAPKDIGALNTYYIVSRR